MKTRKKLNYRFLAGMLVAAAVLGVGVHFVHGYQVKRNARVLLDQADKAKEDKDYAEEIQFLSRFLGFEPDNIDARARFGQTLDERAKQRGSYRGRMEAYFHLDTVLRREPQRSDVRKRQVDIAMYLRRYTEALGHLKVLHDKLLHDADPSKVELADLEGKMGRCYEATARFNDAVRVYDDAVRHDPDQIDIFARIAFLLHERLDSVKQADTTMDAMVKQNPKEFRAYLTRAQYRLRFHAQSPADVEKAREDVRKARELAPDEPEVVLAAAEVARAQGTPDKAREVLRQGIEAHSGESRLYVALISLDVREDKLKEALATVRQGLTAVSEKDDRYGDLLHALADLLVQGGELQEAEKTISRLRGMKYPEPLLDYLQARIHYRKNEWSKASARLDKVLPQLGRLPTLEAQAQLLRGQCQEQLGNPDQALLAYRLAEKLDPLSPTAHYRIGALLMSQGRSDDAMTELRQTLNTANKPALLHTMLARALIVRNMRLPRKERDLDEIRRELALAAKESPDASELPILQAETMLLDDPKRMDEARQMIDKARDKHPDVLGLWIASAQLAKREDARRILERAAERPKLADRVELWLARLDYLKLLPADAKTPEQQKKAVDDLRAALTQMEKDAAKLAEADRLVLLNALSDTYLRILDAAAAERLLQQIAKQQPTNLGVRLTLFDLALLAKSTTTLERLQEEIRTVEGEDGVFWRYAQASRLIQEARPKDKEKLTEKGSRQLREARQYLVEAARRRPTWARIPALEADIDELEGKTSAAIDKYNHAVDLGERRPTIVRRLVQLLFDQKRFEEGNQVVRRLIRQENTLLAAGLGKLAAANLLSTPEPSNNDAELALDMALKSISPTSKAYQDHLWLGNVQWQSGKREDAEKSLRRACELGENVPDTWVTLVAFLASTGKKKEAEQVIAQAEKKIPRDQADLALASCYDSVSNVQKAEEHFQSALKAAPEDVRLLRNVAGFYLRHGQSKKAEPRLRTILAQLQKASPADIVWTRRALSAVLAEEGTPRRFDEALALIEKNLAENNDDLGDQHVRVLLLSSRWSRRKEAIRIFEDLDRRSPLPANERFALVRLYLLEDNWSQAESHMMRLLSSPGGKDPQYEAFYARRLLQHDNLAAAQAQLEKLEKTLPDGPLTREIKARVFCAQGRDAEALAVVREYTQSKGADIVRAGLLLEALASSNPKSVQPNKKLYLDEAEKLYRKHTAQSDRPDRFLPLAAFLGRKHILVEAIVCCEQSLRQKAAPEEIAKTLSGILRETHPPAEFCRRGERLLDQMLTQHPDSVPLLIYLADLYDLQGRYDDAEAVYRRALKKDTANAMLLNNLAWLLAFQKPETQKEGLNIVNKAIDLVGPSPVLLDTRGVIHLMMDQSEDALKDLRTASTQSPSASHSFHLARAWAALNRLRDARQAMEEANKRGFDLKSLHPLEQEAGRKLIGVLQ